MLEIERLRAERDALAAELQMERAERLRAEERLRMFEREKLEQMREGAASRERLASELEEARLRAMRAEARQAALDADIRLSEIAERRRALYPSAEPEPDETDEVAEPSAEEENAPVDDEASEPEPAAAQERPGRPGQTRYVPGSNLSKYSRAARGAARAAEAARTAAPAGGARADGGRDRDGSSEGGGAERAAEPRVGQGARGQTRMSDVEPPKWPSQASGGSPRRDLGGAGRPSARSASDAGGDRAAGGSAKSGSTPRGGAASGARGGAAAGRPSMDRASFEARLAAGAKIEVTERFRQFQPVTQSHIKICDWLNQVQTLDEIDTRAAGEIARTEIVSVLALFFERSFLVFKA